MTATEYFQRHLDITAALHDQLLLVLQKLGIPNAPTPNVPLWVQNCFDRYWATSFPFALKFDFVGEPGIAFQGQAAGYIIWWRRRTKDWLEKLEKMKWPEVYVPPLSRTRQRRVDEAWNNVYIVPGILGPEISAELDELGEAQLEIPPEVMNGSPEVLRLLMENMAEGMKGPSRTATGELRETDATAIYLLLMLNWREMFKVESVTQLHRWLTLLFGRNRIGEKKRVEQLCARIGLRFRKVGRPKKYPHG